MRLNRDSIEDDYRDIYPKHQDFKALLENIALWSVRTLEATISN